MPSFRDWAKSLAEFAWRVFVAWVLLVMATLLLGWSLLGLAGVPLPSRWDGPTWLAVLLGTGAIAGFLAFHPVRADRDRHKTERDEAILERDQAKLVRPTQIITNNYGDTHHWHVATPDPPTPPQPAEDASI